MSYEQTADRVRPEDDPYCVGYQEGLRFAEERHANLWKMSLAFDDEYLYCKIKRSVWRAANELWQKEQSSPNTYMAPEGILQWLVLRIPEMKYFNTWCEGQGHIKGFLEGRGIKVKTGGL